MAFPCARAAFFLRKSPGPPVPAEAASCRQLALALVVVSVALAWSYWPTLASMAERWSRDPQYSHGFLVPLFAAVLLWVRRERVASVAWQPCFWGALVLAGAIGVRLLAVGIDFDALDALSFLLALAGATLLVGGVKVLAWSWPAIAFLGFMMPLPYVLEAALAQPLRRGATLMSTYALQTLGCPAFAEGNVIIVEEVRLGVAEACSGLGMLMTFFALTTAVAVVSAAPLWQRLVLVASAAPIAVLANVARITATGVAYHLCEPGSPTPRALMHDLAGWLMMPLALALVWLELLFLNHLFVLESADTALPIPVARPGVPPPARTR